MTERLPFQFSLSCIGEGNGSPLQCSCLENPRDGGAWWAALSGVAQSRTRLMRLSSSSSSSSNALMSFPGGSAVKNLPATQEMGVQSLGQEDPLEKEMAAHSSISCLKNSMGRGVWWATVQGVTRVGHDCVMKHAKRRRAQPPTQSR